MKHLVAAALTIIVITWVASCTSDQALKPVVANTDSCVIDSSAITFTGDIKTILETYCTNGAFGSCHEANTISGFDYTIYANIAFEAAGGVNSTLYDRLFNPASIDPMPKPVSTGPLTLSPCDALKMKIWIENGAPE